ncbi:hypothetical protein CPB84DRAFT_1844777 [Gymnopilus junonius]|uniref:Uncharacterized protein n=1 Tax=Gymnopilus junonius TaxID=109634 RepID=A0A9P5TQP8_GYMJU|nr:hypothetical protein CPB84DRAFT_1844777 [Gymnopilus junonius]
MSSSDLTRLFSSLPPEAQQIIVEKHLTGLFDLLPKEQSEEVLTAATRLQKKHNDAPKLDLRAKRKQISALFDELARDAKVAFIKERSNRDELLAEVLHSLTSWLNDIWLTVYEYNVNFLLAHSCLVFIADALTQLSENSSFGGCKCSVMNLPVEFALRDRKGKVVKRFSVLGPQNVDRILLWVWRDLFVSLFAKGSERDKKKAPDFLEDVEAAFGVMALEWLLYGGRRRIVDDEDEDDDENFYDSEEERYSDYGARLHDDDDDKEDSEYGCDDSCHYSCKFHAPYWPQRINKARIHLRECVEKRMLAFFKVTPSLRLYNTLLAISTDALSTSLELSRVMFKIAGDTPDNLVAALDICIANGEANRIIFLLDSYSYLLRPRDGVTLQCAVAMLEDSSYSHRSIAILEKELNECLRAIYTNVRACFSHMEEEANKKELGEILKLRNNSSTRQDRVVSWVDRVATPSNGPMHPMALAAMMMGLPMLPGSEDPDDGDFLNFLDLDTNDSDLEDLRDEFRPNLKAIFNGWVHLGQGIKGGSLALAKLYVKAIEQMPWLAGSDIVNEMVNKLRERPNKNHVLEALSNLSSFSKIQRKKLRLARVEQQRRAASKAPVAASSTSATPTPDFFNTTSSASSSSTMAQPSESPRSDSPPLLIPVTPPRSPPPVSSPPEVPFSFGPLPTPGAPTASLPFPLSPSNSSNMRRPIPGSLDDVD